MSINDITDETPRIQYVAAAAQTDFDFPFPIFDESDLVVDVDGVTKVIETDYTVTVEEHDEDPDEVGDDRGGLIEFVEPMVGGEIVTIYRSTAIQRVTDMQQNGPWTSAAVNDEFDRLTVIAQELKVATQRSLRIPMTANVDDADIELDPANWANKYMTFDSDGKPTPAELTISGVITQEIVGAALYPRTQAEISVGVTPSDYAYPEGYVYRYGAVADDVIDAVAAINKAHLVLAAAGGGTVVFGPGTYRLTATTTHSVVVPVAAADFQPDTQSMTCHVLLDGLSNIRWQGNGTTLKSVTDGGGAMFILDSVRNFECDGINLQSITAHNTTVVTTTGMNGFAITSQDRDSFNIKFTNMVADDVYIPVYCFGDAGSSFRVRGVTVDNLYHDKGVYTLAFHNNGDNVRASGVHSSDAFREYFIYGVSQHDVSITSDTANSGFASNIKAYDRDTVGIKYRLKTSKNSSNYNVNVESQHAPGVQATPARVIDLDLHIDNVEATTGNEKAVGFQYYRDNTPTATSSNNLWTGIKLSGVHRSLPGIDTEQTGALAAYGSLNTDDLVLLSGFKGDLFVQTGFLDSKQEYITFTPALTFGGASTGLTYSSRTGECWRDGNFIEVLYDFTLSAKGSSTGTAAVSLPFASSVFNALNALFIGIGENMASLSGPISGFVEKGAGDQIVFQQQGASDMATLTEANFTDTSRVQIHARYPVA